MTNLTKLFLRAFLALSILVAAPAALAGPSYRIAIDTAKWEGQSGFLDLSYGGLIGSGAGTAVASNFTGAFDDSIEVYHDNDQSSGTYQAGFTLLSGDTLAYVSQAVYFGGRFTFDLRFEALGEGLAADFGVALAGADTAPLEDFPGLTFTLLAGEDTALPIEPVPGVETVAVPEPSDWLLVATGLFLIGATRRLQQRR
jgi:hypothetical protein